MTDQKIYTRVYSSSSASLVARKSVGPAPLPQSALLEEFRRHSEAGNRVPTALVSCSNRIIDTIQRAFRKHYEDDEPAEDIWIAFIEIPSNANDVKVHSALKLADKCNVQQAGSFEDPAVFSHEFVVEYEIPQGSVLHEVSLQTLLDRGLEAEDIYQPSTEEARQNLANQYRSENPWYIGGALGCFARCFGARAPLKWIAWQLFADCVRYKTVYDDTLNVWHADQFELDYGAEHTKIVDVSYFRWLEDGIETSLFDQWLLNSDFLSAYDMYCDRVNEAEWYGMDEEMLEEMAVSIGL